MRKKKTHVNIKRNLFQSVKGKILLIGILGIDAAIVIGLVGIISINRNANVTDLIENQKNSIDSTNAIFESASTGIDFTKDAVEIVLGQAELSDKAGEKVVDLMNDLSAISEENAASAETTSAAMEKLNAETARVE